jgi:hypothetical protein
MATHLWLQTRPADIYLSLTYTFLLSFIFIHIQHCPNHEAPKATSLILQDWWSSHSKRVGESSSSTVSLAPFSVREVWGATTVQPRTEADIALTWLDRLAVKFI